jgi:hypothetical protein
MKQSRPHTRDFMGLGGWLFADLLLALAMLFFTTSVNIRPVPTKAAPKPTLIQPRLELNKHRIQLFINADGILQDVPDSVNDFKRQIRGQTFLRHRSVGLVIVYGGASDVYQIDTALSLAQKIYGNLRSLGREWSVFGRASYYDPLYELGGSLNIVTLDIFLFAQ